MLDNNTLTTLSQYTAKMTVPVELALQSGEHDKRNSLLELLNQVASVSDMITVKEGDYGLTSAVSFELYQQQQASGVIFSGIPTGHEFNSLILAILYAGGVAPKLESRVIEQIRAIDKPTKFDIYVSLDCHNCPDVVQTLQQFALLNPLISSEMFDGALFQQRINELGIQGVPSVYLNQQPFANGKIDTLTIIDKLTQHYPQIASVQAASDTPLTTQDVTVIGGGPAGVGAAIYAARKGLAVTLVADKIGGQVSDTMDIENLISITKTTGPQLSGNLKRHLSAYPVTIKEMARVESIVDGDLKRVTLTSGEQIESRTIILATGAKWRELGIPGEAENIGKGVAYCPHCDGPFFKGKDVAVVGGGNSGIEAALDLAAITRSVKVYEFQSELKADRILVDKARQTANIDIITNVATTSIKADNNKVSAINYQDRESQLEHSQPIDGVFVQIGLTPNSHFVADVVDTTAHGEIMVNEKCETNVAGIYACGDVTTVPYKQIVVAMGEGAKAALSAFEHLLKAA